jgi:hypothetical protein
MSVDKRRVEAWCQALAAGGHCLDAAPWDDGDVPGLVTETVLRAGFGSSVTVCGSRADCRAVCRALREGGLEAEVYPSREPWEAAAGEAAKGNCKNFGETRRALKMGLPPGLSVCPVCPYRKDCTYFEELEEARAAPHVVATAARVVHTNLEEEYGDREVAFVVHGRGLDILKPTVTGTVEARRACEGLDAITEAARKCCSGSLGRDDDEGSLFFERMVCVARDLGAAAAAGQAAVAHAAEGAVAPRGWAVALKGCLDETCGFDPPAKELTRVCTLYALGSLDGPPAVVPALGGVRVLRRLPAAPAPVPGTGPGRDPLP